MHEGENAYNFECKCLKILLESNLPRLEFPGLEIIFFLSLIESLLWLLIWHSRSLTGYIFSVARVAKKSLFDIKFFGALCMRPAFAAITLDLQKRYHSISTGSMLHLIIIDVHLPRPHPYLELHSHCNKHNSMIALLHL